MRMAWLKPVDRDVVFITRIPIVLKIKTLRHIDISQYMRQFSPYFT